MGSGPPAYSISKAALNALTRMLAAELRPILVNAVCPGWVATDMGGPGGRPVSEGAARVSGPRRCPTTGRPAASSATADRSRGEQLGFARMAILVGGEALFDLVHESANALRAHAGGGPYNTARTLGRLERDVHYLGCLSDDGFGEQLRGALADDGVKLDTAIATPLPTTLALAELDARGSATYRFYTEETSAPALTPEDALGVLPDGVEMLHVGTLGLVLEPTAIALQAVVEAVHDQALVMVDPNCRPTFIPDQGTFRRSLAATLQYAHVLKGSVEDLEYLEPGRTPAEAARALLADGPSVALVTLGGDGALVITPTPSCASRPRPRGSSTRSAPATRSAAAGSRGGASRASRRDDLSEPTRPRSHPLRLRRRGPHLRAPGSPTTPPVRGRRPNLTGGTPPPLGLRDGVPGHLGVRPLESR